MFASDAAGGLADRRIFGVGEMAGSPTRTGNRGKATELARPCQGDCSRVMFLTADEADFLTGSMLSITAANTCIETPRRRPDGWLAARGRCRSGECAVLLLRALLCGSGVQATASWSLAPRQARQPSFVAGPQICPFLHQRVRLRATGRSWGVQEPC